MNRDQTGGDLPRDFQSDLRLKTSVAFDQAAQRLAFHKFHRIEIAVAALSQVKHRGNIRMANASC
jgi:hypothetical protein